MERRSKLVTLWALLGLLAAVIVGSVARPMMAGWRCYQLNASAEHASAQVVEKLADSTLLLQMGAGSRAGPPDKFSERRVRTDRFRPVSMHHLCDPADLQNVDHDIPRVGR